MNPLFAKYAWLIWNILFPAFQTNLTLMGVGGTIVAASGPTFVQSAVTDAIGTVSDQTATWGAGSTSGNGAVVFTAWNVSGGTPAPATGDISDGSGDTFTLIDNFYDSTDGLAGGLYLATTVTAGTTGVTFKCSTNSTTLKYNGYPSIIAFEIHGGSRAADGHNNHTQVTSASTNANVCTSFTPGTSGDLIVMGGIIAFQSPTLSAGTSPLTFTIPSNGSGTNTKSALEYGTQSSAAAINPAMTGSSATGNDFGAVCMGIK